MMRLFTLILSLLLAAPVLAQAAEDLPADQRPRHLVVFNRPGPNFARLGEMREQALAHRDIYLGLAKKGDIIASGRLEDEPVIGLSVFRQGIDEAAIRKMLNEDAIVKAGVLEIEIRYWSIQMGSLPQP